LVNARFEDMRITVSLYKKNEKVKLKKENRVFETMIKSVSPTGRSRRAWNRGKADFGSVEWLISQ
jgi:hypothetical protein